MFDRLYRITIRHTDLPNKILVIEGDSSRFSRNMEVAGSVNQSGVLANARTTIYGLTTQQIKALNSVRRINYPKNTEAQNTITVAVGWRNTLTQKASKYVVIVHGPIIEAIPGPVPDRSMTITSFLSGRDLVPVAADERLITPKTYTTDTVYNGIPLKKWLEDAASALNARQTHVKVEIDATANFEQFKPMVDEATPKTYAAFLNKVHQLGLLTVARMIPNQENAKIGNVEYNVEDGMTTTGGEFAPAMLLRLTISAAATTSTGSEVFTISQDNGMIGMPRTIDYGASVDVILRDPIMPGRIVNLQSKKFPILSSDSKTFAGGYLYRVMETAFRCSFHGNDWMQTLKLQRCPVLATQNMVSGNLTRDALNGDFVKADVAGEGSFVMSQDENGETTYTKVYSGK